MTTLTALLRLFRRPDPGLASPAGAPSSGPSHAPSSGPSRAGIRRGTHPARHTGVAASRGILAGTATSLALVAAAGAQLTFAPVAGPGTALRLNGLNGNYAYVNAPLLETNRSFTVELWARRDRVNQLEHLASLGESQTANRLLRIGFLANNTFNFSFFNNDLTTVAALTDANWHHWACVYNAATGSRQIYRDGILVAQGISPSGLNHDLNSKFLFGADSFTTNRFVGALDELRVWNLARTAGEIGAAMTQPLLGTEPGLVAYYRCDQFSSSETPDASTNRRPLNVPGLASTPTGLRFTPTALADAAIEVRTDSARLIGAVHPYGVAGVGWLEWGNAPDNLASIAGSTPVTGTTGNVFSATLQGLLPATTYYFRTVATNAEGRGESAVRAFRTGGATLTVTNRLDGGPGSLRQRIAESVHGDVITFNLQPPVNEIRVDLGEMIIRRTVTIRGPESAGRPLTLDARGQSRHFHVTNGVLTLDRLRLLNGRGTGGGSIRNTAEVRLERCEIERGLAASGTPGGAIQNLGRLTLMHCTLLQNSTTGDGGAIAQAPGASLFATNSTFAANRAKDGGAVLNDGGAGPIAAFFLQCTFSGNLAETSGGALHNRFPGPSPSPAPGQFEVELQFCTLAQNQAGDAAVSGPIPLRIGHSLFSTNSPVAVATGQAPVLTGPNVSSDQSIGVVRGVATRLTPLGDFGGYTPTHAPTVTSPVLGLAAAAVDLPATDQRGFPRHAASPEVGAVEFVPTITAPYGPGGTWNVYALIETPMTWVNAHTNAESTRMLGAQGHLASIHSVAENTLVRSLARATPTWIGLTDNENFGGTEAGSNPAGGWAWTSGEAYTFQAFAPNYPANGINADGGVLERTIGWTDQPIGGFGQAELALISVIEFPTQASAPVAQVTPPLGALPATLFPSFGGRMDAFDVWSARFPTAVGHVRHAADWIAAQPTGTVHGLAPRIHHQDPDSSRSIGAFPSGRLPMLSNQPGVDDDRVVTVFKGQIQITAEQAGRWTFRVHTDDGFALRLPGRTWTAASGLGWVDPTDPSVLTYPTPTSDSATLGVIQLDEGLHDIEFVVYENAGFASWEVSLARGQFKTGSETTAWTLLGQTSGPALIGPLATGAALRFPEGNPGKVTVPSSEGLNAFPLTVTAWVRTGQAPDSDTALINKYLVSSGDGYQILIHHGMIRAWYFAGPNGGSIFGPTQGLFGGSISDFRWHHVAFVVDTNSGRLYIDGHLRDAVPWAGTPGPCSSPLPLSFGEYAGNFYEGDLDEVNLWNRALSEDEIRARMFRQAETGAPGLLGAWRMQDSTGTTAHDSSGQNRHALLEGGVEWTPSSATEIYSVTNRTEQGKRTLRSMIRDTAGATLLMPNDGLVQLEEEPIVIREPVRLQAITSGDGVERKSGAGDFRLFQVLEGSHLRLDSLILRGGRENQGGAIYSSGVVVLRSCTITNNSATGLNALGGGVVVSPNGAAYLDFCLFNNNRADDASGHGGALASFGAGRIRNSVFRDNSAAVGGGIYFNGNLNAPWFSPEHLSIEGSAILDNVANVRGGGLAVDAPAAAPGSIALTNCTIGQNSALRGGGIAADARLALFHSTVNDNTVLTEPGALWAPQGAPLVGHTILSGSRVGANSTPGRIDLEGSIRSAGWNLVLNPGTATFLENTNGNQLFVNPMLSSLESPGVITPYYTPMPSSRARNGGDPNLRPSAGFPVDQNGGYRIHGTAIDIGAVEFVEPIVLRIVPTASGLQLQFTATPGAVHRILSSPNPTGLRTDWTDLGPATESEPGTFVFPLPASPAGTAFFSVVR